MKNLQQIISSARKIAGIGILAGAIALSGGCVSGYRNSVKLDDARRGVYFSRQFGIGGDADYHDINLSSAVETTPIHPADGGASRGSATTHLTSGLGLSPKIWAEGSFGNKNIRLRTGAEARYSLVSTSRGYQSGFYDVALQPLPAEEGYESYAFTSVHPEPYGYRPYAGLELNVKDKFLIDADVGILHSGFGIRTGHDRWGMWETARSDTWNGKAVSYGLRIGPNLEDIKWLGLDKDFPLSFRIRHEDFEPEFFGEKQRIGVTSCSMEICIEL